jgi:6-pyruvoyltetrahydropterin/6-carboxytetrahydropterin synthase
MFELKIITHFSAAHQLKEFRGACESLHGHNWKIEVFVTSDVLDDSGVVIDFRILKKHVGHIMETLDHTFLNDLNPFKDMNPSSENIARYVAEQLAPLLEKRQIAVSRVTAWESDNACATYYPSASSC